MTGGAELRALVRRGIGRAVVGKLRARDPETLGGGPGRRPEALVPPHVAGRADDALARERRIEGRIGLESRRGPGKRGLLRERGVTDETAPRPRGITARHLDELPGDAGSHAAGVDAASPVLVLGRMAGAAISWGQ